MQIKLATVAVVKELMKGQQKHSITQLEHRQLWRRGETVCDFRAFNWFLIWDPVKSQPVAGTELLWSRTRGHMIGIEV